MRSYNDSGLSSQTTYYYKVRAYKGVGIYSAYATANATTAPTTTLTVTATASPDPAFVDQIITFTATVSGGTGIYSYSWAGACSGFNQTCRRIFSTAGRYTAIVTVTSGIKTVPASATITVH